MLWHIVAGLWYCSVLMQAVVTVIIFRSGSARALPALFTWLAAGVLRSFVLIGYGLTSQEYPYIWAATEPVLLALQVWMVAEIHYRSSRYLPRPGSLPRVLLWVFLAVGAGAAIASIELDGYDLSHVNYRQAVLLAERLTTSACAIFLVLSRGYCWISKTRVTGPLARHRIIALLYFVTTTVGYLVIHVSRGDLVDEISAILMLASLGILGSWGLMGKVDKAPAFVRLPVKHQRYIRREVLTGNMITAAIGSALPGRASHQRRAGYRSGS